MRPRKAPARVCPFQAVRVDLRFPSMQHARVRVPSAAAGLLCLLAASDAGARPLRVLTYNVLHGGVTSERLGSGQHLEERLAMIVEGLRALAPDLVGLQEVSVGRRRGHVAARLAEALGFEWAFAATTADAPAGSLWWMARTALGFEEGPAVLSRFPITGTRSWTLASCGERYPRVLVCADVAAPAGPLHLCSTHTNGSACQAASLGTALRTLPSGVPVVLTGDLNATETSAGVRALLDGGGLVDTFRTANPGMPGQTVWQPVGIAARLARRRVDYVLVGGGVEVRSSRVVLDRPGRASDGGPLWPSDHYGVLSEIVIRPVARARAPDS